MPGGRARIRFRWDVATGRQALVVEYDSAPDALPREHEQEHRALLEELRRRGVLAGADGAELPVERVYAAAPPAPAAAAPAPAGGGDPQREPG